jgi:hypothetical protein
LFRKAWETKKRKSALWEAMRHLFAAFAVSSMREIYEALAYGYERPRLKPLVEPPVVGAGREPPNTS